MALNLEEKVTDVNIDKINPIPFSDLNTGISLQDKVVKGKVVGKCPFQNKKVGKLIKIIIKEDSTNCCINVYFFDDYAETGFKIKSGDTIFLSNVIVEKYTGEAEGPKCQIIVDPSKLKAVIKIEKQEVNLSRATIVSSFESLGLSTTAMTDRNKSQNSQTRKYVYTKLNDIKVRSTVNLYGIVKFFKPPYKSRGTDYMMILSIIDPSYPDDNDKLKCLLFNKDLHQFPAIKKVGDIVRFHRLQVSEYKGQQQGNSGPGFSWLIFGGNIDDPVEPRAAFPENYSFNEAEKEKITELRHWRNRDLDLSQDESFRTSSFSRVTCNMYFDLTCQVIATCLLKPSCVLVRVWDGTKLNLPVMKELVCSDDLRIVDDELVRRAKDYIYEVKIFDDHVTKALTIQAGDFIQLRNLHAAKHRIAETIEDGNILPTIEFCLHKGQSYNRGLDILPQDNEEVKQLTRILDEITLPPDEEPSTSMKHMSPLQDNVLASKRTRDNPQNPVTTPPNSKKTKSSSPCSGVVSDRRCMQTSATIITDHHHVKTATLKEVNTGQVPNKYRIRAQVADLQPKTDSVGEFLRLYCPSCHYVNTVADMKSKEPIKVINSIKYYSCPQCQKSKENITHDSGSQQLEYIYMLQFILRDKTGWVMVQLWRDQALKFFDNRDPRRLLKDKTEFNKLQTYLRSLLGYGEENPGSNSVPGTSGSKPAKPWVECCIKSYNTEVGACYQIFDTVMCDDEEYSQI